VGKVFYIESNRVLPGTKYVLPGNKKGSSNGSPLGTAEKTLLVLDSSLFFLKSVFMGCTSVARLHHDIVMNVLKPFSAIVVPESRMMPSHSERGQMTV
jgi:hypothetical protein